MAALGPLKALDPSKTVSQYAHRVWGQEQGLFQPTVYSILQTRDGFLWLGTQDGLVRFDGARFRQFDDASDDFSHSLIRSLAQDDEGNLWLSSVGEGVARVDPDGGFTRFTTANGLPDNEAFCAVRDRGDRLWICTARGLARFDHGHFQVFTTANGLNTNRIRDACRATDQTVWVAGLDFGLSRWTGHRFRTFADANLPANANVGALLCGHDGTVWVGTQDGIVEVRNGATRRFTTKDGLPDNAVSSLAEAADGTLWIGTNDGVSRLRDGQFSTFKAKDGLSHSSVLSLFLDREGSLWAGTKDGIDQFTDGEVTPYTTSEGLPGNDAGPVIADPEGHLWVGSLGQGLAMFGDHDEKTRVLTTRDGLAGNTIFSLHFDRNGDLWAATDHGLSQVRRGAVIATYLQESGPVRNVFSDESGTVWAATDAELKRFDGKRFERVSSGGQSLSGVLALAGSSTMRLFASAGDSLYYMHNGRFEKYSLAGVSRAVDCFYFDHPDHEAWMGTLGSGLLRWKNGEITHVRTKDGLYDNRIYSILRDDRENFWLASSKGIFRVSQKDLDRFADGQIRLVTSIPFSTGQLRFECSSGVQPAACRTRDGRMWFSTTNGVVMVDPDHLRHNRVVPPVQITSAIINGERMAPSASLDLRPGQNNIDIRYTALSFISPEKVHFRYMLEGYDKEWTDAGTRREAFFTNLPPGDFHFRVMASNADGIWNPAASSLELKIAPRLYQRGWFFPLLIFGLGGAVAAAYQVRIRRIQRRYDLVLGERNRIARELHDTLLQGLCSINMQLQALWTRLPEASPEKKMLAEIIQDSGKCSTEARQSLWGLRPIRSGAPDFSKKLERLSREAVTGKPIALSLRLAPVSLEAFPETEYQLLRIAQEAIANALAHADAQSIGVHLREDRGNLQMSVEDDGIGFSMAESRADGHFGLSAMRERAEEIGAELAIQSKPGGTMLSVAMPMPQARTATRNRDLAGNRRG